MLHHIYNSSTNDTARSCLSLLDRIVERFDTPKPTQRLAVTPRDIAALRRQGFTISKQVVEKTQARGFDHHVSLFAKSRAKGGRPVTPGLVTAIRESFALIKKHSGRPPHGSFRAIADKHRLKYTTFITRLNFERNVAGLVKRKEAA